MLHNNGEKRQTGQRMQESMSQIPMSQKHTRHV